MELNGLQKNIEYGGNHDMKVKCASNVPQMCLKCASNVPQVPQMCLKCASSASNVPIVLFLP